MSSFLFQNTIIPIQVTLFGMHHYLHVLPTDYNPYSANLAGHARPFSEFFKSCCSHNSCEGLGMLQHTNPFLIELEVDIERLWFSLAVKMPNFWGPKKDKKVINSSTKCLISVKIAIMTRHIIPLPLVNVWLIFDLQKYVQLTLCIFESQSMLSKSTGLLYGVQPAADPYNVVCTLYHGTKQSYFGPVNFKFKREPCYKKKAW